MTEQTNPQYRQGDARELFLKLLNSREAKDALALYNALRERLKNELSKKDYGFATGKFAAPDLECAGFLEDAIKKSRGEPILELKPLPYDERFRRNQGEQR